MTVITHERGYFTGIDVIALREHYSLLLYHDILRQSKYRLYRIVSTGALLRGTLQRQIDDYPSRTSIG